MTYLASARQGRRKASLPHFATVAAVTLYCLVGASGAYSAEGSMAAVRRLSQPAAETNRGPNSVMMTVAAAGNRVVAAGERGLVVYSDDCGAEWKQARVPVSVTLTALNFVDSRAGWLVGHGGVVLATSDGGTTWTKQLDGMKIAELAVQSVKAGGVGDQAKRRLVEAERLLKDGPDKPLFSVHFWTKERGIAIGAYGIALMTADGGAHWQWVGHRIPNPRGVHLYGMTVQQDLITIVGEQGLIVRSTDGGQSFSEIKSPYPGSFFGIVPVGKSDLVAFGLRGNAFRLSGNSVSFSAIEAGTQASLLSAVPVENGDAMLFDANGQAERFTAATGRIQMVGNSLVGPVAGAARACGDNLAIAGFRGVTIVNASTMAKVSSSKERP